MELICEFIRLILQSIKLIYQSTTGFPAPLHQILGPGGKQPVQMGILREMVHKGDNHIPVKQKPLPRVGVGHIGELVR